MAEPARAVPADPLQDLKGAFVLRTPEGRTLEVKPEACTRRYTPFSTFKIANSLFALELKAVQGPDERIAYDPARHPPEDYWPREWQQDHTLRSAFRCSAFWYFQEVAERIGPERMRNLLARCHYGNQDCSGRIDRFWLDGPLAISPREQVDFLQAFHQGELGLRPEVTAAVRSFMLLEEGNGARLFGKTGSGPEGEGFRGWLVGFVENPRGVAFYALTLEGPDYASISRPRMAILKRLLAEHGVTCP